jgi:mannitol/fructose-specific phosphotransferase system IIA component (Ntr-type)
MAAAIPVRQLIKKTLALGSEIRTLEQAIGVMLERMVEEKLPAELVPQTLAPILQRETIRTTAIGAGWAVPHCNRLPIPEICGILAVSQAGIDGQSLDGELVYIVLLLLFPDPEIPIFQQRTDYSQTEAIWKFIGDKELSSRLRQATTEAEIEFALQMNESEDS